MFSPKTKIFNLEKTGPY